MHCSCLFECINSPLVTSELYAIQFFFCYYELFCMEPLKRHVYVEKINKCDNAKLVIEIMRLQEKLKKLCLSSHVFFKFH